MNLVPPKSTGPANPVVVPHELLAELRSLHRMLPGALDGDLNQFGLARLRGGRNNRAYRWSGPQGPLCLKLYRTTKRDRARCEFTALRHLIRHGLTITSRPIWHDPHPELPAVAMSLVPGTPITALDSPMVAFARLITALGQIRQLPLGPFIGMGRLRGTLDVLRTITKWSEQLSHHLEESSARDLIRLRHHWASKGDACLLVEPAPLVLSSGDANLDNWFWHGTARAMHVLDWEFAGHSTISFDTAEFIEHPSARIISDEDWLTQLPNLGIGDDHTYRRFMAARRAIALYWLAIRWKHRHTDTVAFENQLYRARSIIMGNDA